MADAFGIDDIPDPALPGEAIVPELVEPEWVRGGTDTFPTPCPGCADGLGPHFNAGHHPNKGHCLSTRSHTLGRSQYARAASEHLDRLLPKAVQVLEQEMDSSDGWKRLQAAKAVVEKALPKADDASTGPALIFPPGTTMEIKAPPVIVVAADPISRRETLPISRPDPSLAGSD